MWVQAMEGGDALVNSPPVHFLPPLHIFQSFSGGTVRIFQGLSACKPPADLFLGLFPGKYF